MTKKSDEKFLFMVHVNGERSPTDSGNRLVQGQAMLADYVNQTLGKLTETSKNRMRGLTEQDEPHVIEMFRGNSNLSVYDEVERRSMAIYWIRSSVSV